MLSSGRRGKYPTRGAVNTLPAGSFSSKEALFTWALLSCPHGPFVRVDARPINCYCAEAVAFWALLTLFSRARGTRFPWRWQSCFKRSQNLSRFSVTFFTYWCVARNSHVMQISLFFSVFNKDSTNLLLANFQKLTKYVPFLWIFANNTYIFCTLF